MAGSRETKMVTLFLTLAFYLSGVSAQAEIVVKQGNLQGTTLTTRKGRTFPAFLGIPYAQPPVGPLRFKNPLPAGSWNGTFVADSDFTKCPQLDEHNAPIGSEDCLYLNVYTPRVNTSVLYPTMVYIHGGAYVRGSGNMLYVGPGYIMDKDVVLVTMNYRLGVLGFLSTGDAQAPGNFGLKDQSLALRWVQDNIEAFGGDPKKVTIFGQSAGGVSVNLHALSDLSDGLFHQYISQSGSSLCFWAFHDTSESTKHAIDLGEYLNCPTNNTKLLIDCLREVDAHRIVDSNDIFNGILKLVHTWVPTSEPNLEGAFLTTSPIKRIRGNKMKDYPSICGDVAHEGLTVTAQLYTNSTMYNIMSEDIYNFLLYITKSFIGADDAENLASNVANFYFKGVDPHDKLNVIKALTDIVTDTSFLFPTAVQLLLQKHHTKSPIYYYSFDYRGTVSHTIDAIGTNDNIGVTHIDELIYLFPKPPAEFGFPDLKMSENDEHIIDILIDFWTSFAYTGIPTTDKTCDTNIWKPYDNEATYLKIGSNTVPSVNLYKHFQEERMRFWLMRLLHMMTHVG